MKNSDDFDVAYQLHKKINPFGVTENAVLSKTKGKENYKPKTLVDQTLELVDPNPNIYTLFVQFNERFFNNVLLPVEVKWSNRMTSCAGTCTFHPRNRQCVISISAPLLKLRPRKDLVETLLHEMIHGYLFLTNNNRDRDGHGPEFCKHMNRINKIAGTNITIYHTFHNEVRVYQQHWWRCNGPCQKVAPYFGTVRRAMNRAPGPSDFWWKQHQQNCTGQFIKIKEPENFKANNRKNGEKATKSGSKTNNGRNNTMDTWLGKTSTPNATAKSIKKGDQNSIGGFKKLGAATNNVHGWGTRGPTGNANVKTPTTVVPRVPLYSYSGPLGGSNTGRSNLLDKFAGLTGNQHKQYKTVTSPKNTIISRSNSRNNESEIKKAKFPNLSDVKLVECPLCGDFVTSDEIGKKHGDFCSAISKKTTEGITGSNVFKGRATMESKGRNNGIDKSQIASGNWIEPVRKRATEGSSFLTKQTKRPKLVQSENSGEVGCPVCNKRCQVTDINKHLDECLKDVVEQDYDSIVEPNLTNHSASMNESTTSSSSRSSSDSSASLILISPKASYATSDFWENDKVKSNVKEHKCFICGTSISPNISLNDHLEDCIGSVFNEESMSQSDLNNEEGTAATSVAKSDSYPCPVCMKLFSQSCMNAHLDVCLQNA